MVLGSHPNVEFNQAKQEVANTNIDAVQLFNVMSQIQAHGINSLSDFNKQNIKVLTLVQDVVNEFQKNFKEDKGARTEPNLNNFSFVEASEIHFSTVNTELSEKSYDESATFYQEIEPNEPKVNEHNAVNTVQGPPLHITLAPNLPMPVVCPLQGQFPNYPSVIHLNDKPGNLPLQGNICSESLPFLVDTGAAITAISGALWERLPSQTKHPPEPTPSLTIRTVTGDAMMVQGMAPLTFGIGNRSFSHNVFIINSLSHDVILGKDFLELHKSKIDLGNHTLHLQDALPFSNCLTQEIDHTSQDPPYCSVHALQSYILPPNTETIICGKLNSTVPQGSVGIVDPRSEL